MRIAARRSSGRSNSAAISSTPPGPTARHAASGCSARLLRRHPGRRAVHRDEDSAEERKWPARAEYPLDEVFPADHVRECTEKSLENLGVDTIDLQQFHVWGDELDG